MTPKRSFSRIRSLLKSGVARGFIPFSWGSIPAHHGLRQTWRRRLPTSFSDKLKYKLVHDRRPILKIYADKLAVRDYVRAKCPSLRMPRVLAQFAHEDQLIGAIPPAPWVMKASHGSSMILICDRPGAVSEKQACEYARRWLHADYAVRFWEWQYLRLPRRIIFEEFLGRDGHTPDDYKFHVIHQKVRFISVDQERYVRHTRNCFWPDWTPIPSQIGNYPLGATLPPRPASLSRMIEISEELACDSDFVRIDLYEVGGEVYFGEITHSPAAGYLGFADPAVDELVGSYWTLPHNYTPTLPRAGSFRPKAIAVVS